MVENAVASSGKKGAGCGTVILLVVVAVLMQRAGCFEFGENGHEGAAPGRQLEPLQPARDRPPADDRRERQDRALVDRITNMLAGDTYCGSPFATPPTAVQNWATYACLSRREAADIWDRCLSRTEYTNEAGRGCPGSERCCPDGLTVLEARARDLLQLCGDPPVMSAWDGGLGSAERFVRQTAHDPDSINIENCSRPILDENLCWVTECAVRGRNVFGGMVLNYMRFQVMHGQVVGAEEIE